MRIAIVTDYYYPALGGITEHVDGQARSLQKRGHEVTIITGSVVRPPRVIDDDHARDRDRPFEVIRMGWALPFYGNASETLHTVHPLLWWKLKALLKQRRFDVVHTHAPYNPGIAQVAPYVVPRETTIVGTYHSVFSPGRLINTFARVLRPSIARLDGHIVVSEACVDSLKPYFPFDYTVIPNGIDETHFSPDAEPVPELQDGRKNILFLGRFDPRNGLQTMIDAFTEVRRTRDDVRLVIVGDGPLRRYYARRVPPELEADVVWVGRVNRQRPRYYVSADIFCTPCDRASFGMVLLEAMSSGVPVVASAISGFKLLMEHERQGLLVDDPRSAHGFAEALTRLLDAPEARAQMGAEGRCRALERFAWPAVAERLEEYYVQVTAERKARR